jgi:hypothetical protein
MRPPLATGGQEAAGALRQVQVSDVEPEAAETGDKEQVGPLDVTLDAAQTETEKEKR